MTCLNNKVERHNLYNKLVEHISKLQKDCSVTKKTYLDILEALSAAIAYIYVLDRHVEHNNSTHFETLKDINYILSKVDKEPIV